MSVKFKVGFTIDGETLFGMIAKFLPIEDLQVEEIAPPAPRHVEKIARLGGPENRQEKPKRRKRPSIPMRLDQGANAIIMKLLADGKAHGSGALKPLFREAGYADNGVGSRLTKLRDAGVIFQPDTGLWQLSEAHLRKTG